MFQIKVVDLPELCVSGEVHSFEAILDQKLLSTLSHHGRGYGEGASGHLAPPWIFGEKLHLNKEKLYQILKKK
jgi:hypothetical protein